MDLGEKKPFCAYFKKDSLFHSDKYRGIIKTAKASKTPGLG